MTERPQILICDDDKMFHLAIKYVLKEKYDCKSAYNTDEALKIVKNQSIAALLLDIEMRTPEEGIQFIPIIKEVDPDLAIVMVSGKTDFQSVKKSMQLGASDYIPKAFQADDLAHTIALVLERQKLVQIKEQQNFEVNTQQKANQLIGRSSQINALKKSIEKIKMSSANVIITGETGTGKEVIARSLRGNHSDGTLAPFVAIDSATIQSSTAESMLFGHEKGAFTGAEKQTKGIFEEAQGGIVYFDEIGNMPLEIQAKLLRVIQEKQISRLGSSKITNLDFRVICATNKNLDEMVKQGLFKDDLLQRLNVISIHASPLRERKEDIPELLGHFLHQYAKSTQRKLKFTAECIETLQNYNWPGNIRELGNLVAFLLTMIEGDEIDISDLPPKIRDRACNKKEETGFYKKVSQFEKELLTQEYQKLDGNVSKLALSLGMDRSHLYTKLREYKLH